METRWNTWKQVKTL